ncbi:MULTISPECIES: hypothetical protein [Nocardia]|uniref:hypothetical protein n=1 Tax=Nocardia TaxID=1817 RepID=UPI000D68DD64|nr:MULTISPECIES: hypothetical protein [Nocardia]
MRKLLYFVVSASAAASVIVGTAGVASAQTLTEYCIAGGGRVVTQYNPPKGTITICQGGRLNGHVLSVNR